MRSRWHWRKTVKLHSTTVRPGDEASRCDRGSEKWACMAELVLVDHSTVLELFETSEKAGARPAVWSLCVGVVACERKRGRERGGSGGHEFMNVFRLV